ncbi:GIY-YIG nuclease family protein [Bradyrhizobium sp. WSM1417]|uniref:GIY-YIG nuclease family protein n=1 Tax=Bradyrhizobium sp. WSM1417 TaxID=754500 RepID=UPI0004846395|nr:GIY-YIG nuclease family protein [Bradyrhizobium sp. WSM1417]
MVYFVRAGEFIKIGSAADVRQRLINVQTGCPFTLEPLLVLRGGAARERQLHSRFRAGHIRGDWFRLTDDLLAFIADNRTHCVMDRGAGA